MQLIPQVIVHRLGPGPYGLPYRGGEPNIRHTTWERDPKKAMSQTLLNLAQVQCIHEHDEAFVRS